MKDLEAEKLDDLRILVILTTPPGQPQEMTANLMGPVVTNLKNRRGMQMIIEDPGYSHRYRILSK